MFIHFTHPKNADSILEHGIRSDMAGVGGESVEWVLPFYDVDPVYLTTDDSAFIRTYGDGPWSGYEAFEVDVGGLPLAADIASLVDKGAQYGEGMLYIGRHDALSPLVPFADEYGWIEIEHLVDPESDAAQISIQITGTAACLAPIDPTRIRLRDQRAAPRFQ